MVGHQARELKASCAGSGTSRGNVVLQPHAGGTSGVSASLNLNTGHATADSSAAVVLKS